VNRTLGTQLRHLIELLDSALEGAYVEVGLKYRPRYTPVVRALIDSGPLTIGQIAEFSGITQPAATQTVALMVREGIVVAQSGKEDGRTKVISLTPYGHGLLPKLEICWRATALAAKSLDKDLHCSLSEILESAIEALTSNPYGSRIRKARSAIDTGRTDSVAIKHPKPARRLGD
jgi:MarR family transcriptional regulator, organic hydroperoxide resistance regulator